MNFEENFVKDNKLSEIEKFILWRLLKRGLVASRVAIRSYEEVAQRYDDPDIDSAWASLRKKGYVTGEISGGGFGSATAYKKAKKVFRCKFFFYKRWKEIRSAWIFLWKHFLLTIILALATSVVTNSLVINYLIKRIGL